MRVVLSSILNAALAIGAAVMIPNSDEQPVKRATGYHNEVYFTNW